MKKYAILIVLLSFAALLTSAQKGDAYTKTLLAYQKNYITTHEVVKEADRKYFRFYKPDPNYRFDCRVELSTDTTTVSMKTSANTTKYFKRYGHIVFKVHDTTCLLMLYKSLDPKMPAQYKDLLFLPFMDLTTGDESYGSGRYIDLYTTEIKDGYLPVDFNKAYNPYCAYATGFRCPVPPRENTLPVAIFAGEKNFAKPH